MKDLSLILLYLFCLVKIFKTADLFSLCVFGFLTLIFFIAYSDTKRRCKEYETHIKTICVKQKNEFIDILNHDIKVPILAQLQALGVLMNGIMGGLNTEQKELIEQTEASCKYTLNMISMINNANEIDNNAGKLNYEKFNMTDLLFSCFSELSCSAKEKKLTFSYSSKTNENYIEADFVEIKKVITSLLINAINYSNYGGEIVVSINNVGSRLTFSISGMNLLGNISGDINRYTTIGHNIGMYLCKKIIEFHNGKFYPLSRAKNTLSFIIPTRIDSVLL